MAGNELRTDTDRPLICRGDLYWITPDATSPGAASPDAAFPDATSRESAPPGTRTAPAPAHPHVVVQDDVFNQSRIGSVVVCALTTNLQRASEPGNVLLDAGEGNLPRASVVVVSQIDAVDKRRLGPRIGTLSAERVDQVVAGLRFQQASFFRR